MCKEIFLCYIYTFMSFTALLILLWLMRLLTDTHFHVQLATFKNATSFLHDHCVIEKVEPKDDICILGMCTATYDVFIKKERDMFFFNFTLENTQTRPVSLGYGWFLSKETVEAKYFNKEKLYGYQVVCPKPAPVTSTSVTAQQQTPPQQTSSNAKRGSTILKYKIYRSFFGKRRRW